MTRSTPTNTGEEHEHRQRPLQISLIKRLFGFTKLHAHKRNCLLLITATHACQVPALSWAIAATIAGPINNKQLDEIIFSATGVTILAIITYVSWHFRMRLGLELGEAVVHDLRGHIFAHLQRMSMHFYDKTKLGRIISRITSDCEALRMGVQEVLVSSLVQTGRMLIAAAIMLWYDWILFMVVLAMAPGLWLISQFFRGRLSHTWRNVQESFSRVTAALAESVNGIRVTQGFVRQDRNAEQFRDLVQNHSDHHLQAAQLTGVFLPLLEWNSQFFISILLLLGGYQVLAGGMLANTDPNAQFESLVVFFFMVNLFFSPITVIGKQYNMALTAMAGAERVFALLDTKPQQLDRPDAIPIPMIRGRVEFANVCFAYEPETQVLTDINFIAKPGQTIAMVGPTGSGKSTIIKLVSKFYLPTSGQILIDGNGLHQIRGSSYVKQLGIVLQQNFLFTGTVYDNIRVGKISATDNDVRNAARRLDCLDLIQSLPSGFNTEVGEAGGNLSLGQRQLVCFCRAMLADPRILILDEATSSVDTMTESRIQRALAVLLSDRTSFVVAHRMSTIRHADKVLVLNEGKIVERGTHTHLLTTDGLYAKLYRQFIHTTDM